MQLNGPAGRYRFFQAQLSSHLQDLSLDFNDRPIEIQGSGGELVQIRCASQKDGNLEVVTLSADERTVRHEVYQPDPSDPNRLYCLERLGQARNLRGPGPIPIPSPIASPLAAVLSAVDAETGEVLFSLEGEKALTRARDIDTEKFLERDFRLLRE